MKRYLIGVGNETMTDDGIGPRVAQAVSDRARALGFEGVVIGHDSLGIISYLQDAERVVFVDCVRMGRRPGDWLTFSPQDVDTVKQTERMTTHEGDLLRVIEFARQIGNPMPEITIVGIEPQRIEPGLALSEPLSERLPEYEAAVLGVIARQPHR